MRFRNGKWLIAAGLVAGGFVAYRSRSELQQWASHSQSRRGGFEEVAPSPVYFLQTNRWLEFDVPQDAAIARIVTTASISPTNPAAPGTEWPYAVEYQLRGSRGLTNLIGVYNFKGEHVMFVDKQTGKPAEVNSYLERGITPLSGRHWVMNLRDPAITDPQVLRVRLQSAHPDLLEVGLRVYFRTAVPERKIAYLWDRLSEDQKRDLARGNVYSFEGLNASEKYCLMRYHWEVASPAGIPGRDFTSRNIYVRDDSEKLQQIKDWVPAGLAVDADHFGMLALTNSAAVRRLELTDYSAANAAEVITNTFLWHPELQPQIETNRLVWSGTNQTVPATNGDGLLQIASSRRVYVRAFETGAGVTNEITPEPEHVLMFACSATNSVEYDIDHVGSESTLFRVDLRRLLPSESSGTNANTDVRYALLSDNGAVLQSDRVVLTNLFSPYDWFMDGLALTNISVAQSLCFLLPPAVRGVRISSAGETIFASGYSRPPQLAKRIRVPEDYSPARALMPTEPSWFTLRPRHYIQRREAGQTAIVRVQTRPPEYDPLIQEGQYEWDSFLPESDLRGQMILLPPNDSLPPRPDSLPFTYFPVNIGAAQRLRFEMQPAQPQVEPTLMLLFTNGTGGSATISVDGQTVLDTALDAPVTAVRLGNLKAGEHALNVRAAGAVSAYVNCLGSATNAAYLQRFCTLASSNTLRFPYVKRQPDQEILVLRIFSAPSARPQPFHVRLKLGIPTRGIGPFSDMTIAEREAEVTPAPGRTAWLVAAMPSQVDEGVPVFFPIGSDLPPGRYDLEVTIDSASPRWLSLSRTTPGLTEKLKLTSQRVY